MAASSDRALPALSMLLAVASLAHAETRVAVAPGPEATAPAQVGVFDLSGTLETSFFAYGGAYGANLAFGDVDGDAKDEILTGPGPSAVYGPQVRAFERDGSAIAKVNFYAYGTLRYGVDVAGSDIDLPAAQAGGVHDEIVTGAGPGAVFGPHVRGFSFASGSLAAMGKVSYYAYGTLKYGVEVADGDYDGDLFEEILTVPGPSPVFAPHVRAFSFAGGQIQELFGGIFGPAGARLHASGGDVDDDGFAELLLGEGPSAASTARVRGFDYDATAIAAIPGLDFAAFACAACGARPEEGRLDGDPAEEILAGVWGGAGAASQLRGFDFDGAAVTPIAALDLTPFPASTGVKPAVSDGSYEFRPAFLWGTAAAAHQVEGSNTNNDWYEWELLGKTADPSGSACEWYAGRYDQDFAQAEQLSHSVVRISLEWSRIEPQRDVYDLAAIAFYHQMLASARAHGLEPLVTLHHFTNPIWVLSPLNPATDLDGWVSQETEDEFVEFAAFCATEYGAEVDDWVTINEPVVTIFFGYLLGAFPPGNLFDVAGAEAATQHMIFGHARAYDAIHANDTTDANGDGVAAAVSLAHHTRWFLPADPASPDDRFATAHLDYLNNDLVYNAVNLGMLDLDWDEAYTSPGEGFRPELVGRTDYIGVNYYGTYVVTWANLPPLWGLPQDNPDPNVPKSECGTEIYPQGLFRILERFHRKYHQPLLITENGLCDADDDQRADYVEAHLRELLRAEAHGAEMTGYCHWSLVDNFEWLSGYGPKFGFLEVDFATQARTVRPSALAFQSIIQANTVP